MADLATDYWNQRYGGYFSKSFQNSGAGTHGPMADTKLQLLKGLDIQSITDIGCGDFHFAKRVLEMYPVRYTGLDISQVIIEKNKKDYPQYDFRMMGDIPEADLLLCIDVLFHILDDKKLEELLSQIEDAWTKYLAVTAYEKHAEVGAHMRIQPFDYRRFGKPKIRQVIDDDQLYFYLYKKSVPFNQISCCLITKDLTYPKEILDRIAKFPFGEILILTSSDCPGRKQELFHKAKYNWIYYQDDDCIAPIQQLYEQMGDGITLAMKQEHFDQYKNMRMTMGLGWGAFFPKKCINVMQSYRLRFGEDELYRREDTRIMTYLNYPQTRLVLPIYDLPSATAPDRLYRQPVHYDNIKIVEERCKDLVI